MNNLSLLFVYFFIFFTTQTGFSQYNKITLNNTIRSISSLKLSEIKKKQILEAVFLYEEDIKNCETLKINQFILSDSEINLCYTDSKHTFSRKLHSLLGVEQFYNVFETELTNSINIEFQKVFRNYTLQYPNLNKSQQKELKKLIKTKVKTQIATKNYLIFDQALANYSSELLSLKGHLEYINLLKSFKNIKVPVAPQNNNKNNLLVTNAKKGFVDPVKVQKLIFLLLKMEIDLKEEQVSFNEWNQKHIIYNHDTEYNAVKITNKYREKIHNLLTKDEYEAIFKPSLQNLINRRIDTKWTSLNNEYNIEKKYHDILKKNVDFYTKEEVVSWIYNKHDSGKSWTAVSKVQKEADKKYSEILNQQKHNSPKKAKQNKEGKFNKYSYFRLQSQKANIDEKTIEKLVKLLKKRDLKEEQYRINFSNFKEKYLVYFHDNENSIDGINNDMKGKMAKLISLEQFSILFQEQLAPLINSEVDKRLQIAVKEYNLNLEQKKQLHTFFKKQVSQEINVKYYFGYNHSLAIQKLRGVQYRSEKKYKKLIESLKKIN